MPPERLRPLVHPRDFKMVSLDGANRALISVVPFEDQDFRAAAWPSPRARFGQTNYRIYVVDRETGQRAVWFLGTTLGSWTVAVPRYLWRLPWHHGRFAIACAQDATGRYTTYRVDTQSCGRRCAGARRTAAPDASPMITRLTVLTHPLPSASANPRDGRLGSYSVWHERLVPTGGRVRAGASRLLDRLGVVPFAEQAVAHSVLSGRSSACAPRRC